MESKQSAVSVPLCLLLLLLSFSFSSLFAFNWLPKECDIKEGVCRTQFNLYLNPYFFSSNEAEKRKGEKGRTRIEMKAREIVKSILGDLLNCNNNGRKGKGKAGFVI